MKSSAMLLPWRRPRRLFEKGCMPSATAGEEHHRTASPAIKRSISYFHLLTRLMICPSLEHTRLRRLARVRIVLKLFLMLLVYGSAVPFALHWTRFQTA